MTQPNVYRGQFLKGYICRIFTSGQFLKGNICGMFTRRQSLKGNICGIFTGGPSLNGNTYLWNVLVDTGHCGHWTVSSYLKILRRGSLLKIDESSMTGKIQIKNGLILQN